MSAFWLSGQVEASQAAQQASAMPFETVGHADRRTVLGGRGQSQTDGGDGSQSQDCRKSFHALFSSFR